MCFANAAWNRSQWIEVIESKAKQNKFVISPLIPWSLLKILKEQFIYWPWCDFKCIYFLHRPQMEMLETVSLSQT